MDGFTQSLLMFPKFLVGFGCPVCFPNGFQIRASRLLLENAPTEYLKTVYCITSTSCDEKNGCFKNLGAAAWLARLRHCPDVSNAPKALRPISAFHDPAFKNAREFGGAPLRNRLMGEGVLPQTNVKRSILQTLGQRASPLEKVDRFRISNIMKPANAEARGGL